MRRAPAAVATLLLLVAACSSGDGTTVGEPSDGSSSSAKSAETSSSEPALVNALVGEWERLTTCQQRVKAFQEAGLEKYAARSVADDGYIPGVTSADQLEDPEHPCAHAEAHMHSHFFTADGLFGSRDQFGQQVDDGTYRVVDDRTFFIGTSKFHYRVNEDGDVLRLFPVLPACARRGCFEGQWEVAVTYNGLPWHRIG